MYFWLRGQVLGFWVKRFLQTQSEVVKNNKLVISGYMPTTLCQNSAVLGTCPPLNSLVALGS